MPAGTRRNIPEETIDEPPPGPEERVGFEAAIWRERARQKAAEREAERRAREAETATAAASEPRAAAVTVGAPASPLSPRVDNGAVSTTTLAAADSARTPAVAPKPSSTRKASRTLASIAGTPGLGTAKTSEHFGAFQSSPFAPSKSAAKEIASLARNLRF